MVVKVKVNDCPFASVLDSKSPLSSFTLCDVESSLVQVTFAPTFTVSGVGSNAKFFMVIVFVVTGGGDCCCVHPLKTPTLIVMNATSITQFFLMNFSLTNYKIVALFSLNTLLFPDFIKIQLIHHLFILF
jgi:hypothetical protein